MPSTAPGTSRALDTVRKTERQWAKATHAISVLYPEDPFAAGLLGVEVVVESGTEAAEMESASGRGCKAEQRRHPVPCVCVLAKPGLASLA